jgi:hypothetical protein
MFRVHRYAATQVNPVDVGVLDTLRFHRLQLERQRDFRRGIWRWQLPALLPGLVCFGLFALYCIYRMHRHVAAESSPADAGVLDTLRYQRRQLERQRDFRRGSWRWQFWGVLPGYALTLASMYFENDPVPWVYMGFVVLVLILGLGLQAWSGERGARRSQREIDALDSLAGDL